MVKNKKILVTGGLGFIGFNSALHFANENEVAVIDDCSRLGVENNIEMLKKANIAFSHINMSRFRELRNFYYNFSPDVVIHMAAQVAVTLSIDNPYKDYLANIQGSFNLLELARTGHYKPIILYASTNKVYGGSGNENVSLKGDRYVLKDQKGYSETTQLSFETPYGCSKGAADQYFIDYFRTYGVPTVTFRQSCIYGPYQFGVEDQGWLAWFAICALFNKPITIYGDGNQVRDVLYIDNLIELYEKSIENIEAVQGEAFNIGGGCENTLSLNEFIKILNEMVGQELKVSYKDWRHGDQRVYISNIDKIEKKLGWKPKTKLKEGLKKFIEWAKSEKDFLGEVYKIQHSNKEQIDISVIIPAKNEEECLPAVLDELNLIIKNSSYSFEVILVNDRSTDRTVEIAKEYPFVRVINSKYNPGKGGTLRSGFDEAKGQYFVMMDADFSHDAGDIQDLIDELIVHKGLVIGSRLIGGSEEYTRLRAFGNVILTWAFGFFHSRYLSDALNGFKAFHRDVYRKFQYTSDEFEIEIELLVNTLRLNREITEISSRERARKGGKVKSSVIKHGTLFLMRILVECLRKPKVLENL